MASMLLRNAAIGLASSISSDVCSNSIRVLKTTKQAAAAYDAKVTYRGAAALVIEKDGLSVSSVLICFGGRVRGRGGATGFPQSPSPRARKQQGSSDVASSAPPSPASSSRLAGSALLRVF